MCKVTVAIITINMPFKQSAVPSTKHSSITQFSSERQKSVTFCFLKFAVAQYAPLTKIRPEPDLYIVNSVTEKLKSLPSFI